MAQQPPFGQDFLIVEVSRLHSDTPHSVGLLWTSDRPVTETSTWQHSQETVIHALSGIRTNDTSKRAAAEPHLRPLGHWYRQGRTELDYLIWTKQVSAGSDICKKIFWELLIALRVADILATNEKGIDFKDICRSDYFDSVQHTQSKYVICFSKNILSNSQSNKVLKPSAAILM